MNSLLALGLSNLAVATVLAMLAWSAGRWLRRPALTHGLWLLVILKLLTPPLFSIPVIRTSAPIAATPPAPVIPAAVKIEKIPQEAVREASRQEVETPKEAPAKSEALTQRQPTPSAKHEPAAVEHKTSQPAAQEQTHRAAIPLAVKEPPAPVAPQPVAPIADVAWSFDWSWLPTALTWTWLTGAALWLALALVRLIRFQRLLRWGQSAPAELRGLARDVARRMNVTCPKLVLVPGTISPMLWVLGGKPRLVLPAALIDRLSPEQWQTLLAHELAHWRRRDHWVRWLELAALGLYWWCPLVWWAKQELQQAEEECCDAWVVTTLPGAAREYALALVETVDFLSGARTVLPPAASGLGHIHLLRRRLTMILRGRTPRALTLTGLAAVLSLGLVLLPLAPTLGQDAPPAAAPAPAVQQDDKKDDKVPDREEADKAKKDLKKLQDDYAKLQKDFAEKQQDLAKRIREAAQKAGVIVGPEFGGFPGIVPPGGLQPLIPLQPGVGPQPGLAPQPGVLTPPVPFIQGGRGDLERRLDDLERKLDKLIEKLGGGKAPGKGEDRPRGGAAEGREEAVQPAARVPGAPLNIQAQPAVDPKR